MKKNIGVIFGGDSVEHEISIITAIQAMENMDKTKYNIIPIYMTKSGALYSENKFLDIENFKNMDELLKGVPEKILYNDGKDIALLPKKKSFFKGKDQILVDAIFPIVHGTNVEDGKLQGYLETLRIPYIGTTVVSGVVGQDKGIMKDVLKANGINQADYIIANERERNMVNQMIEDTIGYPVIVKPASLGSSIGIFIARNNAELTANLSKAFKYDSNLVIETLLTDFEELNVSVRSYDGEILVSEIERVSATEELLSYEDKYLNNSKGEVVSGGDTGMASLARELPAQISSELKEKIQDLVKRVYKILRAEGVIRIDMMIKEDDIYINEINNIPGSLAFYLWEESGVPYQQLLDELIEEGIKRYYQRKNKNFTFSTNVLSMKSNGKLGK